MAGDIEEFLRMAAQRKKKSQQSAPATQRAPIQQSTSRPQPLAAPVPIRPQPSHSAIPVEIISPSNHLPAASTDNPYDDDHYDREISMDQWAVDGPSGLVSQDVSSDDIASHADHLGDRLKSEEKRMSLGTEQRLGEAVGKREFEKHKTSAFSKDLVKMLGKPDSITMAVVMNQILNRPNFD